MTFTKSSLMKLNKETLVEMVLEQGQLSDLCGTGVNEEPKEEKDNTLEVVLKTRIFQESRPVRGKDGEFAKDRHHIGSAVIMTLVDGKEVPVLSGIGVFESKGKVSLGFKFVKVSKAFQDLLLAGVKKQIRQGRVLVK